MRKGVYNLLLVVGVYDGIGGVRNIT